MIEEVGGWATLPDGSEARSSTGSAAPPPTDATDLSTVPAVPDATALTNEQTDELEGTTMDEAEAAPPTVAAILAPTGPYNLRPRPEPRKTYREDPSMYLRASRGPKRTDTTYL